MSIFNAESFFNRILASQKVPWHATKKVIGSFSTSWPKAIPLRVTDMQQSYYFTTEINTNNGTKINFPFRFTQ